MDTIEATHMMIETPNTNAQGRRTFGYLLSEMIKVKKGTIEPRTLEMYESNSRRFIPKHIMQMPRKLGKPYDRTN